MFVQNVKKKKLMLSIFREQIRVQAFCETESIFHEMFDLVYKIITVYYWNDISQYICQRVAYILTGQQSCKRTCKTRRLRGPGTALGGNFIWCLGVCSHTKQSPVRTAGESYFCQQMSDNYADLSDNYVDLSDNYVDLSDN